MTLDIVRLLELSSWRAFDVDDAGRVLAGSDETGVMQLVEITPSGHSTPLTALPGAVTGRYLPGERTVVVQHDDNGDERTQLSLLRLDNPDAKPATVDDLEPLTRDPEHVHRLLDVLPGRIIYATNRRDQVDFDVIIRSALTGEELVVYDRGGLVLEAAAAPDTRYVAITVPGEHPSSEQLILINTMPTTEDEHIVVLTDRADHARYTHVRWLPDDSKLIVTTNSGRDLTGIAHIDPHTGERQWLVTSDEHDLDGWLSPDGTTLLVHANDNGTARFSLHAAETGELLRRIRTPIEGWCSFPLPTPVWSPNARFAALSFSAPAVPGDVLLFNTDDGTLRALTHSCAQLRNEPVSEPTTHFVPTASGEQLPCSRYAPVNGNAQASTVVFLHGGPESQSVRSFNPIVQALVAQGHTVVAPNVRGSTGYGKRWYSADDQRNRWDAIADLAAVHDWLPTQGLDPSRAALWGGSYGGYLVLAGLAFQPQRWAAGVEIVGISSLLTFLENTASYRRAHREREYGSLERHAEFLREVSPLTHADAISAPLFIVHGANDPRVPLSEAQQIAEAVRAKKLECSLLVYGDEGHGLTKRANRLNAYPRAIHFLGRHLAR